MDVKSVCADKTLAQDTGVVCGGPGVQVTGTGAYAYACCQGDLCNTVDAGAATQLQVPAISSGWGLRIESLV